MVKLLGPTCDGHVPAMVELLLGLLLDNASKDADVYIMGRALYARSLFGVRGALALEFRGLVRHTRDREWKNRTSRRR